MGAATKGGGCVSSGARNKMTSKPSTKVAVMMKDGGEAKKKDKNLNMPMARGIAMAVEALAGAAKGAEAGAAKKVSKKKVAKKMGGGMMKKYKKGGYAGCK
jgi:hypothetical protein